MICSNCGAKLEEDDVFCGECGIQVAVGDPPVIVPTEAKVAEAVVAAEEVQKAMEAKAAIETVVEEEVQKSTETKAVEVAIHTIEESVETASGNMPVKKEKKAHKGKIVILIVLAVLLLAAVGVAIRYFTSDAYNSHKNMKKAEAAFAEQEYEAAGDYYKAALECDDTIKEAYIKCAEIDMQRGKYKSAIKTLQKGIKKTKDVEGAQEELTCKLEEAYVAAMADKIKTAAYTEALELADEAIVSLNTDRLVQKKEDIYDHMITAKLAESDYYGAINTAKQAYIATSNEAFQDKQVEIYLSIAKDAMANGDEYSAVRCLEEGYEETKSPKLADAKEELLNEWIDDAVAEGDFEEALDRAESAYYLTDDKAFEEKQASVYVEWAESYMENEDYAGALKIVETGLYYLEADVLVAKREELISKQIIINKRVLDVQFWNSVMTYYNEKGLETEVAYYDETGLMVERRTYLYDEAGNLITCTEYDGEKDSIITQTTYEYDDNGVLVTKVVHSEEETIIHNYEYTYNHRGNPETCIIYDQNGSIVKYDIFDEKGNILETQIYDEEGKVVSTQKSVYDENGVRVEAYSIASKEDNYHIDYMYDADGVLVFYRYTDDTTGDVTETSYVTTREGNEETQEAYINFNGEESSYEKRILVYDEQGNLICVEVLDKDGLTVSSYYAEYDAWGNETYVFNGLDDVTEEYTVTYEYGFAK